MALEAAVYQQDPFSINNNNKDLYPLLLEPYWSDHTNNFTNNSNNDCFFPYLKLQDHSYDSYLLDTNNQLDFDYYSYNNNTNHEIINHDGISIIPPPTLSTLVSDLPPLNSYDHECWGLVNSSSPDQDRNAAAAEVEVEAEENGCGYDYDGGPMVRPKQRRRARAKKNQEEIENQRMTHIAVERNRRKQMNEYLNVLRSLMPDSYVQRGDQASIVGAAINFVKELEHNLQSLSAKKKQMKENGTGTGTGTGTDTDSSSSSSSSIMPFGEFFTFPQFSSSNKGTSQEPHHDHASVEGGADVQVTMVESHAHLKIRLRRPPKQLSKLISGFNSLRLSVLHLNVNTAHDGVVLYTFSLKVEAESKLNSVDDIAREVYLLLGRIQEEAS